jgi:hypothetical protein
MSSRETHRVPKGLEEEKQQLWSDRDRDDTQILAQQETGLLDPDKFV